MCALLSIFKFLRSLLNFANLYVLLMTYYTYLHVVSEDGTSISQMILFLNVLVGLYCLINNCKRSSNLYIKGLNRFFLLLSVYGFLLIMFSDVEITSIRGGKKVNSYWYLMELFTSILPIFSIYYFTIKGYLKKEMLILWLVVFILLAPKIFIDSASLIGNNVTDMFSINRTSNVGYVFVAILPAIALFNKNIIFQLLLFGYCIAGSFICMKRGPILICVLCLLIYFIYKYKNVSIIKKLFLVGGLIMLAYIVMSFFTDMADNNAYFLSRIEETKIGESSGRDDLFSEFIGFYIFEANLFEQLFGLGAYGTLKVSYNLAHNDWLEILIGQGLLGVFFYFSYWKSFYKTIKMNKNNQEVFFALSFFFCIYFMKTFFSMSYNDMSIFSTLFFGYYLAKSERHNSSNITV